MRSGIVLVVLAVGCGAVAPREVATPGSSPQAPTGTTSESVSGAPAPAMGLTSSPRPAVDPAPPYVPPDPLAATLYRCLAQLSETWRRPLEHTVTTTDPRFPEDTWTLEDGAARRLRWVVRRRAGEDEEIVSSSDEATVMTSTGETLRLSMHTSGLRPPDFVARQGTRIDIERAVPGERAAEIRLDSPLSNHWTTIEMLTTDARACARRLTEHGRSHVRRIRALPAERCAIGDTRSGRGHQLCRSDPDGHRRRIEAAVALRERLVEGAAEYCAALGSLHEVVRCFPPALLGNTAP